MVLYPNKSHHTNKRWSKTTKIYNANRDQTRREWNCVKCYKVMGVGIAKDNLYGGNELNTYEIYTLKYSAFLSIFFILLAPIDTKISLGILDTACACVRHSCKSRNKYNIYSYAAGQQNQQSNRSTAAKRVHDTQKSLYASIMFFLHLLLLFCRLFLLNRFQKECVSTRETFFCRISLINFSRDLGCVVNEYAWVTINLMSVYRTKYLHNLENGIFGIFGRQI